MVNCSVQRVNLAAMSSDEVSVSIPLSMWVSAFLVSLPSFLVSERFIVDNIEM